MHTSTSPLLAAHGRIPAPIASGVARLFLAAMIWMAALAPVRATTVKAPEFPDLVKQADYVVRAVVKSVRGEMTIQANGRKIHTYVELDVTEAITGTPPSPLVLRLLGGKVGEEEMILQGAPKFAEGEEVILFVRGNNRMAYPLVGIMHGHYAIKRDAANRKYVTRSDGVPLESAAEVSKPMSTADAAAPSPARVARAMSADEFIQQIKGVVKSSAQREQR